MINYANVHNAHNAQITQKYIMQVFHAETPFRSGVAIFLPLHLSLVLIDPAGLEKTCFTNTLISLAVKPNLCPVSVKMAG